MPQIILTLISLLIRRHLKRITAQMPFIYFIAQGNDDDISLR